VEQIEQFSLIANGVILSGMMYYAFSCIFKPAIRKIWIILAYILFIFATAQLFLRFENEWITLIANVASYILLSFLFFGNVGLKISLAVLIYVTAILSEGLSILIINNVHYARYGYVPSMDDIISIGRTIATMIHLLCVFAITFGYRKLINRKARLRTFRIPFRYTAVALFIIFGIAVASAFFISATIDNVQRLANQMIITQFVIALIIIAVIWLYNTILNNLEEFEKNKLKEIVLERWETQYQTAVSSQKQLSTLKHNMRFDYLALSSLIKNGDTDEAQKQILDRVGVLDSIVATDNLAIDTMLNYYKQKAYESLGIVIETGLLIPPNLKLNANIIALILGNALENALDACSHVAEEHRYVNFRAELSSADELLITIENPYVVEPIEDSDGNLVTSKHDKLNHGLGLYSIREILPDEAGQMHYSYDDGIFRFMLIMYDVL